MLSVFRLVAATLLLASQTCFGQDVALISATTPATPWLPGSNTLLEFSIRNNGDTSIRAAFDIEGIDKSHGLVAIMDGCADPDYPNPEDCIEFGPIGLPGACEGYDLACTMQPRPANTLLWCHITQPIGPGGTANCSLEMLGFPDASGSRVGQLRVTPHALSASDPTVITDLNPADNVLPVLFAYAPLVPQQPVPALRSAGVAALILLLLLASLPLIRARESGV